MRLLPLVTTAVAAVLAMAGSASPAGSQTNEMPKITARTFTAGSAAVTVTGSGTFTQDIPLNAPASFSDGTMTYIQFGVSGAAEPNLLMTYSAESGETGITLGRGKFVATAGVMPGEKPQCSGGTEVTGAMVSGHYTCPGITSYDSGTGKMGKVNIEVRFTAKS
jgi:hypothetical protein